MISPSPCVAMGQWAMVRGAAEAKPIIRPSPNVAMGQWAMVRPAAATKPIIRSAPRVAMENCSRRSSLARPAEAPSLITRLAAAMGS